MTVYVGPDEVPYVVDKYRLSQSCEFFKKSLQSIWKEGRESMIKLPEETPAVFDFFMGWLYGGGKADSSSGTHSPLSYLHLFALSEKWLSKELKQASWKGLSETHDKLQDYQDIPVLWKAVRHSVIRFYVLGKYVKLTQSAYEKTKVKTTPPNTVSKTEAAEFLYDVLLSREVFVCHIRNLFQYNAPLSMPQYLDTYLEWFKGIA